MSSIDPSKPAPSFSMKRVAIALLPVFLAAVAFWAYKYRAYESDAQAKGERMLLGTLGLGKPTKNRLNERFQDADADLVADAPKDAAQFVAPDTLYFSYVGGEDSDRQHATWQEFLAALATNIGKKVEYLDLASIKDQLDALRDGRLHIAGVNTGNVPAAVNQCGFVPVVTLGDAKGTFGYTVKIIVPSSSTIKAVPDLRGKRLALTEPGSNSGYKAPLLLLMNDFDLLPQRDFEWVFTYGHDASIQGIASGKYQAAPTASDMLARAASRGEIDDSKYRVIYESERFPPAALGYVYNLAPELAEKVTHTFKAFDWAGTGLEREFSPSGVTAFVPVRYKDDWALVRRIDDAMGAGYAPQ
ncbi:MAG TPA: phosphate/phosphite/phosphonate ABC transporter substrate-binding protein [Pirellulales bacterium]|nr:phosphate/phosphite/phosphonate ABC transporter substrate-binding protein [Pirellulales bacterium]